MIDLFSPSIFTLSINVIFSLRFFCLLKILLFVFFVLDRLLVENICAQFNRLARRTRSLHQHVISNSQITMYFLGCDFCAARNSPLMLGQIGVFTLSLLSMQSSLVAVSVRVDVLDQISCDKSLVDSVRIDTCICYSKVRILWGIYSIWRLRE